MFEVAGTSEKKYLIDSKEYSLKKMTFSLKKDGFKFLNRFNMKSIELGNIQDKIIQLSTKQGKDILAGKIQAKTIEKDGDKISVELSGAIVDEVKSLVKQMEDLNDEALDTQLEFMQKVLIGGEDIAIDSDAIDLFEEVKTDFFSKMSGSKNSAQISEPSIQITADSNPLTTE